MKVKLSFSKINTYIECPRKYFLSYICNLGTGESPHMTNGTLVHKCCEDFPEWPEEDKTYDKLLQYYYSLVPTIDKSNLIHESVEDTIIINPVFESKAIKCLKSFYEDYMENFYGQERAGERPNIILQEEYFNLKLGEPDEHGNQHEIRGLIDRIDYEDGYGEHIIDYKSGQSRITYKALEDPLDSKAMQLGIYALVRYKQTGKVPFKTSFFYIEPSKNAKKQVGQYRSMNKLSVEQLEKVEEFLGNMAEEIAEATVKSDFPTGDNPNCFWCPFNKQCDIISDQQIREMENKRFIGEDKVKEIDNSFWEE